MAMEEYLGAFAEEAREHLTALNNSLLELEKSPESGEAINRIFRAAHTLKGMAATMGFTRMSDLSHKVEDVFSLVRDGKLEVSGKLTDTVFAAFDLLNALLAEAEKGEEKTGIGGMVGRLEGLAGKAGAVKKKKKEPPEKRREEPEALETAGAAEEVKFVKVPTERLENLVNLAGELVTNKNKLMQIMRDRNLKEFEQDLKMTERLVSQLQGEVLGARMIPVAQVFNRFPRMVRDLAKGEGKEVELAMEGTGIEMDRTVLDKIAEPLVHLLRNAVDHGIETPDERKKAGKGTAGKILLSAKRSKDRAIITVEDDGAGITIEEAREIAARKGILPEGGAKNFSEEELFEVISTPGFSSSGRVTETSGRGVGLNVVRETISSLGGSVEVSSEKGRGTMFELFLPLSVAIIKVLLVKAGKGTYAIPVNNIIRTVEIRKGDIKTVQDRETMIFDKEDIALARLGELFRSEAKIQAAEELAVVVESGKKKAGLIVDGVVSEIEAMVKPLDRIARGERFFSGATILAGGEVVLIIDVASVFRGCQT